MVRALGFDPNTEVWVWPGLAHVLLGSGLGSIMAISSGQDIEIRDNPV